MYTGFYKLRGLPFQLGPDPRFFYGSSDHQKVQFDKAEANVSASEGLFEFPAPRPAAAPAK